MFPLWKKFVAIFFMTVLFLAMGLRADAIPLFGIGGTVTDENGNPVTEDVEITLTNETRKLELTVKVGEGSERGTYVAIFSTIEENQSVAEAGEKIMITAKDAAGKKLNIEPDSYEIKAEDIGLHKAIVNLKIVTNPPEIVELAANPTVLPGDGAAQSTLTATVEDAQGKLLFNQKLTFTIAPNQGTISPVTENEDGTYTATYTTAKFVGDVQITAHAGDKEDKVTLTLTKPIIPSATRSTIEAEGSNLLADGEKVSTITITVKDEDGNPIGGKTVEVSADGEANELTQPTQPTDADGRTTATLTSTKAELKTIKATVLPDGIELANPATVTFRPGPASNVEMTATPTTLDADGVSTSEILITVSDKHGNRVSDEQIHLTASVGEVSTVQNAGNGTYRATYTSPTIAEPGDRATVTASTTNTPGVSGETEIVLTPFNVVIRTANVTGSPAKAGTRIEVTITTEPLDGDAKFSIQGIDAAQDISMPEEPTPGQYKAGYTVREGDNVTDAPVTITFTARAGKPAVNTEHRVTIDTIPPPAPTRLVLEGGAIVKSNEKAAFVRGKASPNAQVIVTLIDEADKSIEDPGDADAGGDFVSVFDASGLQDGDVIVRAVEVDDAAGNEGIVAEIIVIKTTDKDFSLNVTPLEQTGNKGESVLYSITVSGVNQFNQEVTLTVGDLPVGISATLDPKTVTPTLAMPPQSAQLILRIGADAEKGEHTFTVIGESADEKLFHKREAKINVKAVDVPISLTLLPSPDEVALGETIKLIGDIRSLTDEIQLPTRLSITLAYQTPSNEEIEQDVITDSDNKYATEFTPEEVGTWNVTATWKGDSNFNETKRGPVRFEVTKGISRVDWDALPEKINIGQSLDLGGVLHPALKDEEIRMRIVRPSTGFATTQTVTTDENGRFDFPFTPDEADEWLIKPAWDGNAEYSSIPDSQSNLKILVTTERAAIVLLGGGNEADNPAWERFNGVAQYVYTILRKRTYTDDQIYFLSPAEERTERIDDKTTKERLKFAIETWAKDRVNANVPLLLYMISHNTEDQFLIQQDENRQEFLSVKELADMLDLLPDEVQVNIIIEACHSGNFIIKKDEEGKPLLPRLIPARRTVVVSARSDVQAQLSPSLSSFSKVFFDHIDANWTLAEAFSRTEKVLKRIPRHREQNPQIDTDGNGVPNTAADLQQVADLYIPEDVISAPVPPQIVEVNATTLPKDNHPSQITATVRGAAIQRVFATVTPPDYNPTVRFTDWSTYDVPIVDLHLEEGQVDRYVAEYDQFKMQGDYTIVVFSENVDGSAIPLETTITVSETVITEAPWDVDGNGKVDIFDLVLVASNFGKTGVGVEGDVDANGKVDIFDLVLVTSHFGEVIEAVSAAPSQNVGQVSQRLSTERLRQALAELDALPNPSQGVILAREQLRAWLENMEQPVVKETKLGQNYPNPFNPETWIPYQLSEPTAVTITIYDTHGRLIRSLDLGLQSAGFYT